MPLRVEMTMINLCTCSISLHFSRSAIAFKAANLFEELRSEESMLPGFCCLLGISITTAPCDLEGGIH